MRANKTYFLYILSGLFGFLSYHFSRIRAAEQHQIALQACTTKLQDLRQQSEQIDRVNLYPIKIGERWGYKNGKGEILIPPKFDRAERFNEGRAIVINRNWLQGFINSQGELVIPQKFRSFTDFAGGVAYFSGTKDEPYRRGFIDRDGKIILDLKGVNAKIDTLHFSGFRDGRVDAYLHKQESVPWGFLMPYGNPVPRVNGFVDCTGKESYEAFVWKIF